MSPTLRDSMHLITDPANLQASVREVFGTMLGVRCEEENDAAVGLRSSSEESVAAVVGFAGTLSGACVLQCDSLTAQRMAACMTGMEFESVDEIVKDGIGEICNMLAGAWKSRIPGLSTHCNLSIPAVITGRDYGVHVQAPEFRLYQAYSFDRAHFEVTIICDGVR